MPAMQSTRCWTLAQTRRHATLAGETPWDRARANDALQQSDGYWRLNDARFEEPREESSRRPRSDLPRGPGAAPPAPRRTGGPTCEIPGYPSPARRARTGPELVRVHRRLPAPGLRAPGRRRVVRHRYRLLVHGRAGPRTTPGDQRRLRFSRRACRGRWTIVPVSRRLQTVI